MRNWWAGTIALICVAFITGCGGGGGGGGGTSYYTYTTPTTNTGNISGYAYVPIGAARTAGAAPTGYEPLPNAKVSVSNSSKTTTTNSNGYYYLSGVPTGTVTVTISKSGYASITKTVTVVSNQTTTVTSEGKTSSTTTQNPKKWTVMVYMAGDNNLELAAIGDLLEMMEVGSDSNVNVIVQQDLTGGLYSSAYGYFQIPTDTYRYYVVNGDVEEVQDLDEQDMTSKSILTSFIKWGVNNYPADKYALILWNHGGGWISSDYTASRVAGGFGADATNHPNEYHDMNLTELRNAISAAGKKFDLIGFDACLMGQVEVAYELRTIADYMVASEESEPSEGWDYKSFLSALRANPNMSESALGIAIVDSYISIIPNTREGYGTLSVVDLSTMESLKTNIDTFANQLISTGVSNYINAINSTQKYGVSQYNEGGFPYRDLYRFSQLTGLSTAPNLQQILDESVYYNRYYGSTMANSNGLSIYLPDIGSLNDPNHSNYNTTSFGAASAWTSFVNQVANVLGTPTQLVNEFFYATIYWNNDSDVDMYVLEPDPYNDGQYLWYAPWTGATSMNGYFSSDSAISGVSQESYITNTWIYPGTYYVVVVYNQNGTSATTANVNLYAVNETGQEYTDSQTMSLSNPTCFEGSAAGCWEALGFQTTGGSGRIMGRKIPMSELPESIKEQLIEEVHKKQW